MPSGRRIEDSVWQLLREKNGHETARSHGKIDPAASAFAVLTGLTGCPKPKVRQKIADSGYATTATCLRGIVEFLRPSRSY